MLKQGRTKAARFGAQYIRCVWNYEDGQWYYSVVDCISVLVGTKNPLRYWTDFKCRVLRQSQYKFPAEIYAKCVKLNLESRVYKKVSSDTLPADAILVLWGLLGCPGDPAFHRWILFKIRTAKGKHLHRQRWKEVV